MKTMQDYTLYCTEEQTKRVFNLGALINYYRVFIDNANPIELDGVVYRIPTAEQMRGWLCEKNIFINVCHNCDGYGTWLKKIVPSEPIGELIGYFETEPQAILAAIDAALNYLEKGEKL